MYLEGEHVITTKRTMLQPLTLEDASSLFSYRSLAEVATFQGWVPKNISEAEDFIRTYAYHQGYTEGQWKQFGIYARYEQVLIGDCGFCLHAGHQAEIGFTIAPAYQRKGLGSEVVESLLHFLVQQYSIRRVLAKTDPDNIGSRTLLERLGFQQEALLVRHIQIRGEWKDDVVYVMDHLNENV